jgi:predicted O-linked N-acetylglucosamine transferase (SPINDLY family)
LHLLGVTALQRQEFADAADCIRQAIVLKGRQAAFHSNLGAALRGLGRTDDAIASLCQATLLAPHRAEFHFNLGNAYRQSGQVDEARSAYLEALARIPNYADAHNNLANLFKECGDLAGASEHFLRVLQINPRHVEAITNLSAVRIAQNHLDEAEELCRQALELHPKLAEAHNNQGMICLRQGRIGEAVACYRLALSLRPDSLEFQNNLGTALVDMGQAKEAVVLLQQVLARNPSSRETRLNLANAWRAAGQIEEAIACLQQVLHEQPDFALAHNNLGNCWKEKGDIEQALACYLRATKLSPDLAEAHVNLALVLQNEGDVGRALAHYESALKCAASHRLRIQHATLLPPIYSSMDDLLQWRQRLKSHVAELVKDGVTVDPAQELCETTFYLPYQGFDDREIQQQISRLHCSSCNSHFADHRGRRCASGKIRVGVISRYFYNHTIGRLTRGLIAKLSRGQFEVTVISAARHEDEISRFIRDAADRYVVISDRIPAARRAIAELDLDILLFTDIGMDPITYSLAHSRLAGVQCVTWGHPITTGLSTIDYFISSRLFETDEADRHYTERLVRLDSPGVYYYRPKLASVAAARSEFGLPDDRNLYGCPQSLFKLHPEFDPIVGEILRRDPRGEVILLSGVRPNWNRLILERFAKSFPDVVDRVRFLPRQSYDGFIRLQSVFDVLLDPLHYSGGNTSFEAFACGTPIVTLPSAFLRGRITRGLYQRMNLTDCVVASPEDYVLKAVRLATDEAYRTDVRERIMANSGLLFEDHQSLHEFERFFQTLARG